MGNQVLSMAQIKMFSINATPFKFHPAVFNLCANGSFKRRFCLARTIALSLFLKSPGCDLINLSIFSWTSYLAFLSLFLRLSIKIYDLLQNVN